MSDSALAMVSSWNLSDGILKLVMTTIAEQSDDNLVCMLTADEIAKRIPAPTLAVELIIYLAAKVRRITVILDTEAVGSFEVIGFQLLPGETFPVLDLRTMPYDEYLQTMHWRHIRRLKLDEAGHRCEVCNAQDRLQVHHRTYERRGEEQLSDLTVLCADCHGLFHEHRKLAL